MVEMLNDGKSRDMEHLGDGVYASHDGYQVWLRVNNHLNPALVALDRDTLVSLVTYAKGLGLLQ